jgi:DndB-like DNA-sulfur modification-associated protein
MSMFEIPVPVIAGKHSKRLFAAQTISPLGSIQSLLGHDPRAPWKSLPSEIRAIYEQVQRKTDRERKTKLQHYLVDRMSTESMWIGGLPAIAIGVQNPMTFKPHDPDRPQAGLLYLDTAPENKRILFDGLGRVSTAMDIFDDVNVADAMKVDLRNLCIPVTIYLPNPGEKPLLLDELGQMFHDFNVLGAPVGKGTAIDLDKSDIYVKLAERLSSSRVFSDHGGVDNRGSATPRKGALVTKMTLVKMIRAAVEGPGSHVDHYTDAVKDPHLSGPNFSEHNSRLDGYLSVIQAEMGANWANHSNLHLSTPGWIALGLVYYDIFHGELQVQLNDDARLALVKQIGRINWSPANRDFAKFLGTPRLDQDGVQIVDENGLPELRMFGGSKAFYNLAAYIRHKIGLMPLLTEEQFGNPDNFEVILKAA